MSSFVPQEAAPGAAPLDSTRHINYTQGMVLGVADFTQEFVYHSERIQWTVRDLLGYGTVCGLRVTTETVSGDSKGPRVIVEPGVAVNPQGQMIRVPEKQCAYLNNWLSANKQQIDSLVGSSSTSVLTLYVVLCYRDCPTDQVPIPGEPCRSADEAMAASRLTDDFKLELRFNPPDQRDEDARRDFVAWLSQVEVSDASGASLDDFETAIRNLLQSWSSPPDSPPDFMSGSPPSSLIIPAAHAGEYWQAAFRIWATELRPAWLAPGQRCGDPPGEECVLLAELSVPVTTTPTGDWQVNGTGKLAVYEDRRPYLVPLSLLQDWLLCGLPTSGGRSATGMFVEHPSGQGSYAIVAAGIVKGDGTSRPQVYNGLGISTTADGQVTVTFKNYTQPNGAFQYIVKALPISSSTAIVANFDHFAQNGFVLHVTDGGGNAIKTAQLNQLELMIEVSQY